jgi:hypothetical protein
LKKSRSVVFRDWRRPARDLACSTKVRQQISGRYGLSYVGIRERLSACSNDNRTLFQTAARKQDISGDNDIETFDVLD